jgi:hypothetical protein
VGGPAARGAWAKSRKMLWSRSYRDRGLSAGPVKLKKISRANTEMQTAVIIASSAVLNSSNHAIILPGDPARANGPRVTFASVRWYPRWPRPLEASDSIRPRCGEAFYCAISPPLPGKEYVAYIISMLYTASVI